MSFHKHKVEIDWKEITSSLIQLSVDRQKEYSDYSTTHGRVKCAVDIGMVSFSGGRQSGASIAAQKLAYDMNWVLVTAPPSIYKIHRGDLAFLNINIDSFDRYNTPFLGRDLTHVFNNYGPGVVIDGSNLDKYSRSYIKEALANIIERMVIFVKPDKIIPIIMLG